MRSKTVDGVTTLFHYDAAGRLIAEGDAAGNVTREYVFLDSRLLAILDSGPAGGADTGDTTPTDTPVSAPLASEHLVDNGSAGTTETGIWSVAFDRRKYSSEHPHGTESLVSLGDASYRWTPDIAVAGEYRVYAWWTYHANNASAVPYTVHHAAGTDTVEMNQNVPGYGSRWRLVGTYRFEAGSAGHVQVSSENGRTSADAVRLEPVRSQDAVIVDDKYYGHTERTGKWHIPGTTDAWRGRAMQGAGPASYRWRPQLVESGGYAVYARWIYGTTHSDAVEYRIPHSGGLATVTVDQGNRDNTARWHRLGTWSFDSSADLHVEAATNTGTMSADAVMFVPMPAPPAPPATTTPSTVSAGVYFVHTCCRSLYLGAVCHRRARRLVSSCSVEP